MALTVEDILSRRTRSLLLDAKESIRMAPIVAKIMAEEMNKNEIWIEEEINRYKKVALNYLVSA
jgi:glycerol-3-phosphate dehydrogenase